MKYLRALWRKSIGFHAPCDGLDSTSPPAWLCALLIFPAIVFLSDLAGYSLLSVKGVPFVGPLLILCLLYDVWWRGASLWTHRGACAAPFGIALGWIGIFFWVCAPSDILPAFDSIAVPAFARIFYEQGEIPQFVGAERRVPFLYPPGFPILLADFFKVLSPSGVLILFKYLCVVSLASTPLCWAIMCRRVWQVTSTPLWVLTVAFYLAFVCFDRTLVFGLVIAGKNSQLFQSALMPLFFMSVISTRRVSRMILLGVAGCGMFLIHYSGMYVMALLLGVWSLIEVLQKRSIAGCWRPWAIFALSVCLFAPRALQVSSNPSAVSIATGSGSVDWSVLRLFTEEFNSFIFIFNEIGIPWSYKGTCVAVVLVVALYALRISGRWAGTPKAFPAHSSLRRALACFFGAWLAAALIGYGVLPCPGINLDYVRWFSYNFLSATIGVSLVILGPFFSRRLLILPVSVVAAYGIWNSICDLSAARSWVQARAIPLSKIGLLQRTLPRHEPCQVMTRNGGVGHFMYQIPAVLEYIPVVSNCDVISGTYIASDSYGLDEGGLPTRDFLLRRVDRGPIYFLGRSRDASSLRERYAHDGISLVLVRHSKSIGLWRLDGIGSQGLSNPAP